ncbi:pupal cuticle protein 36-like isoform X3 [Penaeus chinensis]|uniref:pupal cuticle protein 36-like isoform X3 n=1 Tax=Penaeus chinensis TaxID=139456 RepID=UPI001FB7381A|nr:pupal cuticle protein 36-like isoform X3 [Penaeus chinensis]
MTLSIVCTCVCPSACPGNEREMPESEYIRVRFQHEHQSVRPLHRITMFAKLVICAVVAAVASLPQGSPSRSYGLPSGSSSGGFGGVGGGPGSGAGGSGGFGGGAPGSGSGGFGGGAPGSGSGGFGGGATGGFGGGAPGSGSGGFGSGASGGFGGSSGGFGAGGSGAGASGPFIPIITDDRQGPDEFGNYNFNFETANGIIREEQGAPQGETGAVAQQGSWSFTFPDGTPADFSFVADENGFRVESDLLPTPPPLPPHAIAQIEKARQEDAAAAASGGRPGSGSGQFSDSGFGAGQSGFGSGQFSGSGQSGFGTGAGQPGFGSSSGQFSGSASSQQGPSTAYGYP